MRWKPVVVGVGAVTASTALLGVVSAGTAQAAPTCTKNVGNSGLSAAVVAHSRQSIAHRTINATGCDIGIYVGQNVSWVTIDAVKVTGANYQGIFAQKTSHLTVENSTVTDNGFHTIDPSAPPLPGSGVKSRVGQSFGISLFGVSNSTVKGNKVYNNGRGGIGVMDNGPNDPGTITQNLHAKLVSSSYDTVVGNTMWANYGGCGLVAATQNFGGNLSHLNLTGNTVKGTGLSAKNGPDIGGIVVAADLPNSWVKSVRVSGNKVTNSFEGGVIVNAEAPNSWTKDVQVTGNTVKGNNWGNQEAPKTAGVIVFAANPAAKNVDTVISNNTITNQFYGIYSVGSIRLAISRNYIRVTHGGTPIFITR